MPMTPLMTWTRLILITARAHTAKARGPAACAIDGIFYTTTFSSTTGKTYVYTAKDIEHGPWKASSFRPMLHDHPLFFDDDGRVFMVNGSGNIRLTELTADATGLKPGGLNQVIITNASAVAGTNIGLKAEGSQMF